MIELFAGLLLNSNDVRGGLGAALPVILLSTLLIFKFTRYAMKIYWIVVVVTLIALFVTGAMYQITHDASFGKAWIILIFNLLAALIFMRELEKKK